MLISSIAGLCALPTVPYYCAAKHGVVGLFRALRITSPIKHGIRINMINPCKRHLDNDYTKRETGANNVTDFVETPLLKIEGALVMAGGAMAKIEDVVEAATRLVADQGIIGRALVIGPKASSTLTKTAGLEPAVENQAIWGRVCT